MALPKEFEQIPSLPAEFQNIPSLPSEFESLPDKSSFKSIVIGGLRDAAQQFLEGTGKLASVLEEKVPLGSIEISDGIHKTDEFLTPQIPEIDQPDSTLGRMGRGVVQFTAGFLPILRSANILASPKTRMARIAVGEISAILAGQSVIDPHQKKLSNLIEEYPSLKNPVTRYLSSEPDDTEAEARLKLALEDIGLGLVMNGFIESVRGIRAYSRARVKPAEAAKIVDDIVNAKPKQSVIDTSTNIQEAKKAAQRERLDPNINLDRIDTSQQTKDFLLNNSEANNNFTAARRGVQSHQETQRLAETLGMSTDDFLKLRKGTALNAEEAFKARVELIKSSENIVNLSKQVEGGSDEMLASFQEALMRHTQLQERVSGITAEAGRALNQFKILASSEGAKRTQVIKDIIESSGGRPHVEKVAKILSNLDTPESVSKFVRESQKATTMDKIIEVWINSLLSGPQTHAVNMTSNALVSVWTVPEQLLASGFGIFRKGGNKVFVREALARAYGGIEGTKDGLRLAAKAFRTGQPSDILTKIELPREAALKGPIGKIARLPTRFLQAEDELFKTIGYRMEVRQLAMNQALSEGKRGAALASRITEIASNPPESIELAAIDAARYQTFTRPVGPVAASLQSAIKAHPPLKFVVPFLRTPTNILKFAAERTPFGFAMKDVQAAIKQGGRARDIALARMTMGGAVGAATVSFALEGHITGGGPADPDLRGIWREAGHAPYSIKVGEKWYSYQRLEPLGLLLGISADLADITRYLGENDPEVIRLANMVQASISRNLTSKTWLKGISDMVEAISDPDRHGEQWISSLAGTAVPTGVAHIAKIEDPILRDARTLTDTLLKRIPGYSEDLPPVRNIFGEKIMLEGSLGPDIVSPIYTNTVKGNVLAKEIMKLKIELKRPNRNIGGVELTPKQYSEYLEFAGNPATQVLTSLIQSPEWDRMPTFAKSEIITKTFMEYREAARKLMMVKHKDLIHKIAERKLEKVK